MLNNSCYGRRRMSSNVTMATPYGRRTATDGVCSACETVLPETECGDMVLAMAYVQMQPWGNLYEPEEGFGAGTVFPDLDKPFLGGGTRCAL